MRLTLLLPWVISRQNFSLQYQHIINQTCCKNNENYLFGDNELIQYQILWTNIIRIVWVYSKENYKFGLGIKGLTLQ